MLVVMVVIVRASGAVDMLVSVIVVLSFGVRIRHPRTLPPRRPPRLDDSRESPARPTPSASRPTLRDPWGHRGRAAGSVCGIPER